LSAASSSSAPERRLSTRNSSIITCAAHGNSADWVSAR
jgi:hypothetical protein